LRPSLTDLTLLFSVGFGKHGQGKEEYYPWDGLHEMRFRDNDAEFTVFHGDWDPTMTDDQYFGLEEWAFDVRFYNCRSNKAFCGIRGKRLGEPYLGLRVPGMPSIAWMAFDFMKSYHDPRMRGLKPYLKDWCKNISWIATTLLRGHVRSKRQRELLWREPDGMSVRWGKLCDAIRCDKHYYDHPDGARVTTQQMLYAMHHGGFDNPRFLLGFQANQWGCTRLEDYIVHDAKEHIWPIWNGYADNRHLCEKRFGPLFIKPVGGEVNWDNLGARYHVLAKHQLHHMSPFSPICRAKKLYPGPCGWHTTTETVATWCRLEQDHNPSCAADHAATRIVVLRSVVVLQ
jgi:hypothetical protein